MIHIVLKLEVKLEMEHDDTVDMMQQGQLEIAFRQAHVGDFKKEHSKQAKRLCKIPCCILLAL